MPSLFPFPVAPSPLVNPPLRCQMQLFNKLLLCFFGCVAKKKNRELEEKMSRTGTGVDAVAAQIKDSGKSNGNMQWLFVGMWVVFYFFLNNGS